MSFALPWMAPNAPYMPIATVGLLALLAEHGHDAQAYWSDRGIGATLHIDAAVDIDQAAQLIVDAPLPQLERIAWPAGKWSQGLKPTLKEADDPLRTFRAMVADAPPVEARLLRAILTDGVLDSEGVPARSRLLRGVKADLTSVAKPPPRITVQGLATELSDGPEFRAGWSGYGLGLVPEVQTFGGTTGPDASSVGAHSPLLYLLLWRGIMALPPVPVLRGLTRTVGGPLVTEGDVLSWPRWRMPVGLRSLRSLFSMSAIHMPTLDRHYLSERGIDEVYRVRAAPLNTTVAVFRWGEQVMG